MLHSANDSKIRYISLQKFDERAEIPLLIFYSFQAKYGSFMI